MVFSSNSFDCIIKIYGIIRISPSSRQSTSCNIKIKVLILRVLITVGGELIQVGEVLIPIGGVLLAAIWVIIVVCGVFLTGGKIWIPADVTVGEI